MKERAKVYKAHNSRTSHSLSKRLTGDDSLMKNEEEKRSEGNKSMRMMDG